MKNHVKHVHDNVLKKFKCDKCSKLFRATADLKKHISIVHNQELKYQCDICDKKFGYYKDKRKHKEMVHEDMKKFMCNICEKHFYNITILTNHLKKVHEKCIKPRVTSKLKRAPCTDFLKVVKKCNGNVVDFESKAIKNEFIDECEQAALEKPTKAIQK